MIKHVKHCGYWKSIPMITSKQNFILCLLFIHATQAFAWSNFVYEYCQNDKGNYTANSTYKANLYRVLSILPSPESNGNDNGFYSWSSSFYGQSDQVYVVGLCRGDVDPEICRSCLNQSTSLLTQVCPNQKEAIGGFDECMLRYSNQSSFGIMLNHPRFNLWSTLNVSLNYASEFLQHLRTLFNILKIQASLGDSQMKFATGNTTILGFQTIYVFVQCTPDLSQPECKRCLDEAFGDIPLSLVRMGGIVVTPSCNFRYDVQPFNPKSYGTSPTSRLQSTVVVRSSQTSSNTGETKGKKSNKSRNIIIIISTVVPSVAAMVLIVFIGVYTRVKKSSNRNRIVENLLPETLEEFGCAKCLQFDFSTVKDATKNFAERNKIAADEFGDIYKGKLYSGQTITVKCFNRETRDQAEFRNVVLLGSKVRHRNLVRFLGFCLNGDNRYLIYEYLPMQLDLLLFATTCEHEHLEWDKRYKIIKGIARGLLYLHEDYLSTIIHRDIKPRHILLDEEMNPKISGFEDAKILGTDESEVSTRVVGTIGYLDPEYALSGRISVKVDLYSFGVLLLEIVSGQNMLTFLRDHEESYIDHVWRNWSQGTASNIIDPKIRDHIIASEHEIIMRCIQIGLLCTQRRSITRPTMNSVVHMFHCDSFPLPIPSRNCSMNEFNNDGVIESDISGTVTIQESEASQELGLGEVPTDGVSTAGSSRSTSFTTLSR